jgi:pimeloyl-ACP methyl ester carboxylesterase
MASASTAPSTAAGEGYGPDGRSAWLDVDWRMHQRWVQVGRQPLNLVDLGPATPAAGSCPPLIFLHGLSGSWQNWLENLPVFARDRRVLAIDLPGFGASPMPADGRISITGYAQLVLGLMDTLDLRSASLVGNSMGGFVALEAALIAPERVDALVLVASAGLDTRALRNDRLLEGLRRIERLVVAGGTMIATHADTVARRARLRRATMAMAVRHPERLPNALMSEQIRQGNGKPGFVAAIDALTDHDVEDRLGDIRCPTLVYWGREDRIVPVRDAARFVALIPGARSVVLPDTGHLAMLERPGRFNADVAAFLAGSLVGAEHLA